MTVRVDVPVRGMHCAACVSTIEQAAKAVPGVQSVSVNLATERASLDVEKTLDAAALDRAVRDRGYRLAPDRLFFRVDGLTAPEGIAAVEREWRAVPGVVSAQVNYGSQLASIDTLPGLLDRPALDTVAARAGWSLVPTRGRTAEERDSTWLKVVVSLPIA